jgi:hypothetical protein
MNTEQKATLLDQIGRMTIFAISGGRQQEEVYKKKPDENIVGPHEDPNKCICKGTGVIIQGDDHKTPCPFHSKSQGLNVTHKEVIIKEFRK